MSAYYLMKICRKYPESAAELSSSWFYADRVSMKDTVPQRFSMSKVGVVKGPPRGVCWDLSSEVFLSDSVSDSPQIIFVSRKDAGSPSRNVSLNRLSKPLENDVVSQSFRFSPLLLSLIARMGMRLERGLLSSFFYAGRV